MRPLRVAGRLSLLAKRTRARALLAGPTASPASAISEVISAAALTDPDVRRTYDHHEATRREAFRHVAALLAEKGAPRGGLDVDGATDVLLTVLGDTVWHELRTERGRPPERVTGWVCDALPRLTLA